MADEDRPAYKLDPERYQKGVENFDTLRQIARRVGDKKAFIRITEPVDPRIQRELPAEAGIIGSNRDRAVCALAAKAMNTHASIRLLTDAGQGDDAMALGRVLMENAVILQWLLLDRIYRLDLYAVSDALFQRRWAELVEEHFQEKPEIVASARSHVTARVKALAEYFGDTRHNWAQVLHPDGKMHRVNTEKMMKEIATAGGSTSTFQHDVIYFLHSAFVHTTASSMRSFRILRQRQYVDFDLGPNNMRCDEALDGANIFFFQVLQAAADYFHFEDIEAALDEFFNTRLKRPASQPVTSAADADGDANVSVN